MIDATPSPKPSGRRILFIVAYRGRDLDGLALVAYRLEKQYGHEVLLTNGYRIEKKLLQSAPDAIVFDHLMWDFKATQAQLAKSLGLTVIVLPTEGLFQNADEPRQRAGKHQGVNGLVDCQFTWGEEARAALVEEQLSREEDVHAVGCPRFDFYREPYLPLMGSREEFLASLGASGWKGPVILWATNTSYSSRNQQLILRRQVRKGKMQEAEVRTMLEDQQTQFREHSRAVLELARRHPEWLVVIKVHPAEWINPYLDFQKEFPNVRVAFDAPIFKFLYHSDVLLQRSCTTAIEAWMLGKPVLELDIGQYQLATRADLTSGSESVRDVDAAEAAIRRYLEGAKIAPRLVEARKAFLRRFYYAIDGKASDRCAEIIDDLVRPPHYTDADRDQTQAALTRRAQEWERAEDARWVNRIKDLFGISREKSLRFWKEIARREQDANRGFFHGEVEITREMVERLYRDYDRVLGESRTAVRQGA